MNYKQIDEQFEKEFGIIEGYKVCMTHEDENDQDVAYELKKFIHLIYDQAKAEQREIDAKMAEGKKIAVTYTDEESKTKMIAYQKSYNSACDEITKAIREAL